MAPSGLQAFKESHPERGSIVKLSWTPPKDDGKTPITSYVIEYRSPGDQWRGTVLKETTRPEYEISAAGDGSQRFHVRVQAKNKVGKGPPSQYITLSFGMSQSSHGWIKGRGPEVQIAGWSHLAFTSSI